MYKSAHSLYKTYQNFELVFQKIKKNFVILWNLVKNLLKDVTRKFLKKFWRILCNSCENVE